MLSLIASVLSPSCGTRHNLNSPPCDIAPLRAAKALPDIIAFVLIVDDVDHFDLVQGWTIEQCIVLSFARTTLALCERVFAFGFETIVGGDIRWLGVEDDALVLADVRTETFGHRFAHANAIEYQAVPSVTVATGRRIGDARRGETGKVKCVDRRVGQKCGRVERDVSAVIHERGEVLIGHDLSHGTCRRIYKINFEGVT